MRKYLFSCVLLLLLVNAAVVAQPVPPQREDSIVRRIIFIGDAAEMNKEQQSIIPDAA